MNIVVTGGSGYLGGRVCETLAAAGHRVQSFDVRPPSDARVGFLEGDLRDPSPVARAVADAEAVVHLAAVVRVSRAETAEDRGQILSVNHGGTRTLLRALGGGSRRFVFASTSGAYEPRGASHPADEQAPLRPTSTYAESKLAAEAEVRAAQGPTLATTILRFATLFGPTERTSYEPLANALARDAVATGRIKIVGPDSHRPFLHVDDAARAVRLVLEAPPAAVGGQVLNVGDDRLNLPKRRVAEALVAEVPGLEVETVPDPAARDYCVDFGKVRSTLHFAATRSLRDGVGGVVRALRGRGTLKATGRGRAA